MSLRSNAIEGGAARIGEATAADAGDLAALYDEALAPGWPAWEIETACTDPNRAVLKAADGAQVHGFIILQFAGDEAEILAVAVRKSRRRLGHAASLLGAGISACERRLSSCIYLEVAESNTPARKLYEKFGFLVAGRRKDYYRRSASSTAETALIMRRDAKLSTPVDLEKSCT